MEKTIYKARALNPQFPKLIDLPLWEIGHYQVTAGFVGYDEHINVEKTENREVVRNRAVLMVMGVGPQQHIEIIYKTLKSCVK